MRAECWRRGQLSYLLHADQLGIYSALMASKHERFVLEIARKWGKTYLLCVLACEPCLRERGSRVVYGGPSLKHLEEFIQPIMRELADAAPADCRPVWRDSDSHWRFPNGSWIHLFAADDLAKAKRGRGPKAKRALFDEAGFTPVLQYVLEEVFRPSLQLNSEPGDRLTVLGSTPSDVPDHEFTAIAELEEQAGNYAHRTIWDNPMMTREQATAFLTENARQRGLTLAQYLETDTYRREYMAERFVDKNLVAVPEWAAWREESFRIAAAMTRPALYRGQEAIDFGGHDPHAAVFGYWHPKPPHISGSALVVERDLLLRAGETTRQLDDEVKRIESQLWGTSRWDGTLAALRDRNLEDFYGKGLVPDWLKGKSHNDAEPQPYLRISDTQVELVRHLWRSGITCVPAEKDHKTHFVMELRDAMRAKQVVIPESAKDLDRHLRTTTWRDLKRKEWARRADEHGDLVDALLYLWRCSTRDIPIEQPPRIIEQFSLTPLERRLDRGGLGRLDSLQ